VPFSVPAVKCKGKAPHVLDLSNKWKCSVSGCLTARKRALDMHWVAGWKGANIWMQ